MKRRLLLTLFLLVAARAMTIAQTGGGTLQLVSGDAQLAWNRVRSAPGCPADVYCSCDVVTSNVA